MALKKFKAESKRLLDLMINSIYTNKEIFLREVISNASDAIDKLHFISLTDPNANRDFEINIEVDKNARTISISDNGIGMNSDEMESNLGTIARSGTFDFKANSDKETAETLIGQFGVGFYSCFMVASEVTVVSKKYGEENAYKWTSAGVDGYEIEPAQRDISGTTVAVKLKEDEDGARYSDYLEEYKIRELVTKYSDYIRYPIKMQVEKPTENGKGDKKSAVVEVETLNSMIPIWKKNRKNVTDDEYFQFYQSKFYDYEKPLRIITTKVEGNVEYTALLFIPAQPPMDYYAKSYKKGLKLYSSGVLIMENCEKLLPDYLGFVRGVVDSSDLSLNISREMLQHDRQLNEIAKSLEKKILSELGKMRDDERELYEKFFDKFGVTLKFGAYESFGLKIPDLKDLFIYYSAPEKKFVTLKEYVSAMKEGQKEIFFASGSDYPSLESLPQVSAVNKKGYSVLLLKDNVDEFVFKLMDSYDEKKVKSVSSDDLEIETEEEKKDKKKKQDKSKKLLEAIKNKLSGKVEEVRLSNMLGDYAVGLSAKGELSIEMAKVLSSMPGNENIKAQYVLEINPSHKLFALAESLVETDDEKLGRLCVLLFAEALMSVGIMPENANEFILLINEFMA
ncbi:MAG: molecular chaperone HtpG [Clostridia bacterium]|nr:molecular chaperone HtpG [Clostridia bacterium]